MGEWRGIDIICEQERKTRGKKVSEQGSKSRKMGFEGIGILKTHFCIPTWVTHVPVSQPLPKSKKTPSKGGKKERSSTGTTRKAKRTKCPEILSDESSSEEDEKKEKDDSSEEKESEDEVMRFFCCFLSIGLKMLVCNLSLCDRY